MSKVLVVFGATGQQGGSVVSYALQHLSDKFVVKGITRDTLSAKSRLLSDNGVEMICCDTSDKLSVSRALKGANTVFAMTIPKFDGSGSEYEDGKTIADAAVEQGVEYFIWSTLPNVKILSNNEFLQVNHFDSKAEVESYVRKLPMKSSFFLPGVFFQNFQNFHTVFAPQKIGNCYTICNILSSETKVPWIDVVADTGKYVGILLSNQERYIGKTIYGSQELYSFEDIVNIISKIAKKKVFYSKISKEEFLKSFPPAVGEDYAEMFEFYDKYGYWGPDTTKIVVEQSKEIDFKPTTLKEFFTSHPVNFE